MALDYTALQATATRLITENGRSVTMQRSSVTPADPAKPWAARETDAVASDDQSVTAIGVFLESREGLGPFAENFLLTRPATTNVERATRLLLPASTELTTADLEADWYVSDGSTRWEVLSIKPVKPASVLVYYDLQVRH